MAINNYFNATLVSIDFNAVKQVDSKPAASGFADGNIIFDKTEQQFYQALSGSWIALDFIGDDFTVNKLAFNTAATETLSTGELAWNADDETVDMHVGDNVTIQLGQEMVYHVVNQTGSQIDNGTVVMADGALGASGKIKVVPAIADGSVPAKYIMGVATEDIPNGALGYVTAFGKVRGFDTSSYSSGTVLYASATSSGSFTDTAPSLPNQKVTVAITLDQKSNGNIFVRPTYDDRRKSVSSISDLENVNTTENDVVYLDSGGRSGWFKWDSTDHSAATGTGFVNDDPGQGVYIAPFSDATGASGAWVRDYNNRLNVEWFGAVGDDSTDSTAEIQNSINFAKTFFGDGATVYFPNGIYQVTESIQQKPRINILGESSRGTVIKWAAGDLTNYEKGVVYAVDGTDVSPVIVFSTNLENININAGGTAPVSYAIRGQQENCKISDVVLNGFTTAGLDVLSISDTTHACIFENMHIIPNSSSSGAYGIQGGKVERCTFRDITIDIANPNSYARGISLSSPLLNTFTSIHTEDADYGFYLTGGANNIFTNIEASHNGSGVTHFYTTGSRYAIYGMRTRNGYTNAIDDTVNVIPAGTDTDTILVESNGNNFRRIGPNNENFSISLENGSYFRNALSFRGATGTGWTQLQTNMAISPSTTNYLEFDLNTASSVGFAGEVSFFSVGDQRYAVKHMISGYVNSSGTVSSGGISAALATSGSAINVSAPESLSPIQPGKFRVAVENTSLTFTQSLEVKVELSAFGVLATSLEEQ